MTTNTYPNSLVNRVAEAVIKRGTATLDDIQADFPDSSRKQIHSALANARDRKLLRIKEQGNYRAGRQSVWEPESAPRPEPKPREPVRPIPSVWSLGALAPWNGPWPPLPTGRLVARLGPWNEQAEAATAAERTTA